MLAPPGPPCSPASRRLPGPVQAASPTEPFAKSSFSPSSVLSIPGRPGKGRRLKKPTRNVARSELPSVRKSLMDNEDGRPFLSAATEDDGDSSIHAEVHEGGRAHGRSPGTDAARRA